MTSIRLLRPSPVLACALVLASAVAAPRLHAQEVAFTFDDLPAHSSLPPGVTREQIATDVLQALQQAGAPPVYGFVNGIRIEEHASDAAVLDLWHKAGFPLGNHTWSHMNLNEHTVAEFEADLLKNEPVLSSHAKGGPANEDWHWLRFPYLAEGNTPEKTAAVRSFLAGHGYKIAAVTMSFGDYAFNGPYAQCVAKKDTAAIAQLEDAYLKAAADDIAYRRAMAKALFGHDIPYVLLMHIGALDARMLPRLLALYKAAGFHFVSLQQAEQDPFYRNDLDLSLAANPDTLEGAMGATHLAVPAHDPLPAWLNTICQ